MRRFFASLTAGLVALPLAIGLAVPASAAPALSSTPPPAYTTALNGPNAWIVGLGAGLNSNCTRPAALEARVAKTAALAQAHPGARVFVTGGSTRPQCPSEAASMRAGLVSRGVDSSRIVLDDTATSTIENAQAASRVIPAFTAPVLVTNDYHLDRALATFYTAAPGRFWLGVQA